MSTSKPIDALPLGALETRLQDTTAFLEETLDRGRDSIVLHAIYINGSFGADAATVDSDIDVTLSVLETPRVEDVHTDEWIRASRRLTARLDPIDGHPLDVQVYPMEQALQHVRDRARHGGYDTVYDLGSRRHVAVADL